VSLNVAFIAIWLAHTAPGLITTQDNSKGVVDNAAVSSSIYRELGVTPEQWNQIKPYIERFREKAKEQRRTIGAFRDQLMELLAAASVEETAIRAKQEEILSGQRRMQDLVIEFLLKEKEILTGEQQQALLKVIHKYCTFGEACGSSGNGLGRMLIDDSLPLRSGGNEHSGVK
jgi:Spy/CpxP family protein refolding chaperone